MNAKNLICMLGAGAVLAAATPAFADPWHDRGRDFGREHRYYQQYSYEHHGYREDEDDDDDAGYNAYPGFVAVAPPVVVEPPAYYAVPAPTPVPVPTPYYAVGPATFIGAMIGSIIDSQQ